MNVFDDLIRYTLFTIIAIVIYYGVVRSIFHYIYKTKSSVTVKFVRSLLLVVGITIIVYFYLSLFDFTKDVSKVLMQSGSLVIALATFSFQKALGNIVSGIMLSSTKPFDIGDKITLISAASGNVVVSGIVKDMNVRHVVFERPDGRFEFVTNSIIDNCIIENSNVLDDNGRLFSMYCTYDSDVELAMNLMKEEIDNCDLVTHTDDYMSKILCSALTSEGYELKTTIWTNDLDSSFNACSQLRISITKAWSEHDIKVIGK